MITSVRMLSFQLHSTRKLSYGLLFYQSLLAHFTYTMHLIDVLFEVVFSLQKV